MRLTVGQAIVHFPANQHSERDGATHRLVEAADGPVLISIETDPLVPAPDSHSWWDVPIAEVSELDSVTQARQSYQAGRACRRSYL